MKFDSAVGWFKRAHEAPDTDQKKSALHHTIGTGANQAASGAALKELAEKVAALEEGGGGGGGGNTFVGVTDYEEGITYPKGALTIYSGSLYAAKMDTTEPPIISAPDVSDLTEVADWQHNNVAIVDNVNKILTTANGAGTATSDSLAIEKKIRTGLLGSFIEVDVSVSDTSINSVTRGIAIGIIPSDKPLTYVEVNAINSGFYGIRISPANAQIFPNGSSGALVIHTSSGSGIFAKSKVRISFIPYTTAQSIVVYTLNGVEIGRGTIAKPTTDSFRLVLGSEFSSTAADTIHKYYDKPIFGTGSAKWRRITTVADLS